MTAYVKAGPHAAALQQVTAQALKAVACSTVWRSSVVEPHVSRVDVHDNGHACLLQEQQHLNIPVQYHKRAEHKRAAESKAQCESDQGQRPIKSRKCSSDSAAAQCLLMVQR